MSEHLDNQPDGHKADEPDQLQELLERCYRTMHLPQATREAVDADFQTGMAGDE